MDTFLGISTQFIGVISLWFAVGYLSGSVPYGLLISRAFGLGNLRDIGSGNIGATNVLRTGNKAAAASTLLLDAIKGTIPVAAAFMYYGEAPAIAAGFGAFIGHIFPIWLRFLGGKGVATYVGVLLGFGWQLLVAFAVVWLLVAATTRYSSLAGLSAAMAMPVIAAFTSTTNITVALAVMTVIVFATHRANISRLLNGSESRIGNKALK